MTRPSQSCGKFILGGEHSVVYKGRALAFPLPQLHLSYQESSDSELGFILNGEKKSASDWQKILELREKMGLATSNPSVVVESEIPVGAGLGSSAALCSAIAKYHFPDWDQEKIANLALTGERFFHGRASGVDPFTVALKQPILFRSADRQVRPLDTQAFSAAGFCFVLRDSGLRHRTHEVIARVEKVKSENPLIWEDLIDALATNAQEMIPAFEKNPGPRLGQLMNDSHFRLLQLGVSNDALDAAAESLKKQGALGAKLTGAGGGGFVLGLFHKSELGNNLGSSDLLWDGG